MRLPFGGYGVPMHRRMTPLGAGLSAAIVLLTGCTSGSGDAASSATPPASSTAGSAPSPSIASSTSTSTPGTAATPASTAVAPNGTGPAEVTPVLGSVSTEPVPVVGADGATYLAYELYLTNATSSPVTVDSVQAQDASTGAALQTFAADDLVAHSRVVGTAPGAAPTTSVVLGPGQLGIVWLDPSVAAGGSLPDSLVHQVTLTFASAPNPLIPAELTETIARTPVSTTSAPTIASPLNGARWFDGNGCCSDVTPHRGASNPIDGQYWFAERFGIDWVQLTDDGTLITGPATDLASYPYYGARIHAVADGTIVAVSDVLPDQPPGENPPVGSLTLDQFGGNYVVQRFEQNGRTYYAFYAHLKPGTAKSAVTVGQTVKTGDVVGELGNSGNTDSPHLHFHVMDGPDPLASDGLPFQFDSFQLSGQAAGDAFDLIMGGQALPLVADAPTGERRAAMPLYLDIVDLTAGSAVDSAPASAGPSMPSSGASSTAATAPSTATSTGPSGT